MAETWDWFRTCSYWAKANYVLLVVKLCEPDLLYMLTNLLQVLLARTVYHSSADASGKPGAVQDPWDCDCGLQSEHAGPKRLHGISIMLAIWRRRSISLAFIVTGLQQLCAILRYTLMPQLPPREHCGIFG